MDGMLMTILLTALVLFGAVGTVVTMIREDRGPQAPPVSHRPDRRFLPPARGGSRLA